MITAELIIILILIFLNGIFAMSEIAIVSSRKERLKQLISEGNKPAITALELANNPNLFLSTIQIGISLIGILAGAFGGVTVAKKLGTFINQYPFFNPHGETIGFIIIVLLITYLSVVFGEIVPKRLALIFPEKIASFIAKPMLLLSTIASPIVKIFSFSTDKTLKLLGFKDIKEQNITEEEILILLEMGKQSGTIEEEEKVIIDNVFKLSDRQINSFMTQRNQIVWLNLEDNIQENLKLIKGCNHTILPVGKGSLENITGIIHSKKLICSSTIDKTTDLNKLVDKPLFIPETMKGFKALKLFKETGNQFAFVVDEYGTIQGLITLTDIFEEIVGDIPTIEELSNPQIIQREDGSWLIDGLLEIEDFKNMFEVQELPDENFDDYNTIAGFLIHNLEKIPEASDYFEWDKFRFEVVDMDGNRVDKILLTILPLK